MVIYNTTVFATYKIIQPVKHIRTFVHKYGVDKGNQNLFANETVINMTS